MVLLSFKIILLNGLTISIVGRRSLPSLRHANLNVLGHVGGRYARSDLHYTILTRFVLFSRARKPRPYEQILGSSAIKKPLLSRRIGLIWYYSSFTITDVIKNA